MFENNQRPFTDVPLVKKKGVCMYVKKLRRKKRPTSAFWSFKVNMYLTVFSKGKTCIQQFKAFPSYWKGRIYNSE